MRSTADLRQAGHAEGGPRMEWSQLPSSIMRAMPAEPVSSFFPSSDTLNPALTVSDYKILTCKIRYFSSNHKSVVKASGDAPLSCVNVMKVGLLRSQRHHIATLGGHRFPRRRRTRFMFKPIEGSCGRGKEIALALNGIKLATRRSIARGRSQTSSPSDVPIDAVKFVCLGSSGVEIDNRQLIS